MARHWSEKLDPERHVDVMGAASYFGGANIEPAKSPNLDHRRMYFVAVAGFTFQFVSLEQLRECLEWFRQKIHPSSRLPNVTLEHYWQRWYERLPKGLTKEPKRQKIVTALENALSDFAVGKESKAGG
ncbi:MAG TPA: hypothetical protein DDW52_18440 [Planctomycetaceae bacterium]|nr:hypothetical protein [Planctomycetaceae bacterium]